MSIRRPPQTPEPGFLPVYEPSEDQWVYRGGDFAFFQHLDGALEELTGRRQGFARQHSLSFAWTQWTLQERHWRDGEE